MKRTISISICVFLCLIMVGCSKESEETTAEVLPTGEVIQACEHVMVQTGYGDVRFCLNCDEIEGGELPEGVRLIEYTTDEETPKSAKFAGKLDEADEITEGVIAYADSVCRIELSGDGSGAYVLAYDNGDHYRGYMNRVFRHGKGIMIFAGGDRYEGTFENDVMSGDGTGGAESIYTYKNGDVYVGDFSDGKMHGKGTMTYADGGIYEGEFSGGLIEGQGSYSYANGDMYTGEFSDGKREGDGVYIWANGDMYVGEFSDGQMHGEGTYTMASGKSYKGQFENGKIAGGEESVGEESVIEISGMQ